VTAWKFVADPHFLARALMYGALEDPITSGYDLFSMTIQTTCSQRTGGVLVVPHGVAAEGPGGGGGGGGDPFCTVKVTVAEVPVRPAASTPEA